MIIQFLFVEIHKSLPFSFLNYYYTTCLLQSSYTITLSTIDKQAIQIKTD